jgi:type I restriction enzyme S subunit
MAELKPGWRRVKFGDVVRQVKDKVDVAESGLTRYIAGEHMDTDDLKLRRWGEINGDYLGPAFHMRFKPGQVLYGSRRTYLRKVAVADFEGICANTTFVLESKNPNVLLPELLPFIMQTEAFHEHSVKQSKGSVNPYVNFSDLAWYEFALPPLDEQRRMAELLWMHQRLCEEYHAAKEAAETLVASYTEAFLASYKGEPSSVDALLLEPPKNGISPKTNGQEAGYRTVSLSAIVDGKFLPEGNEKYADVDYERVLPFFVQAGDVFVVRGNGNRELTGKCGIAFQNYDDMFYPDLLIRLRFDPSKILPEFAVLQWNASVHNRLISRAKSTNGIWKVNGADIRSHELTVPPLDEQREFLASVGEVQCASQQLA